MGRNQKRYNEILPFFYIFVVVEIGEAGKDSIKPLLTIENISILLSLAAILISIWCVILAQNLTNDANQQQQKIYKQNVAQALYFDIKNLQQRFEDTPEENDFANDSEQITISFQEHPYYTDNGLYFVFNQDIASFDDSNLSANLYDYYNIVSIIERERSTLQRIGDAQGDIPTISTYDVHSIVTNYVDMYENIQLANNKEKIIVERLKKDYNLSEQTPTKYTGEIHSFNL